MNDKLVTIKGLEFLTYASLIAIGWGLVPLITALNYYLNDSYFDTIWFAGFYSLLYLAGGVLFLVGLYKIWKGRHEIDKEHAINLEKTLWIIIIILSISALISGPFSISGYSATIEVVIIFFLLTFMILFTPLFMLKKFSTPWITNMLLVGVSIFVVLYFSSAILQYVFDYDHWNLLPRTLSILSNLIPYTILFFAFFKVLSGLRNKEIKKV